MNRSLEEDFPAGPHVLVLHHPRQQERLPHGVQGQVRPLALGPRAHVFLTQVQGLGLRPRTSRPIPG